MDVVSPTPGNGTPPIVARIVIALHANGALQVDGPVENRQLFYGMLERARDVALRNVIRQWIQEEQARIVPAAGPLPPFKRGG